VSLALSRLTSGKRTHPEDAVDEAAELEPEAEDDPLLAFELAFEPEEAVALAAPEAPEAPASPEAPEDAVAVPLIRKRVSVFTPVMLGVGDLPGSALGGGLECLKGLVSCSSGVDPTRFINIMLGRPARNGSGSLGHSRHDHSGFTVTGLTAVHPDGVGAVHHDRELLWYQRCVIVVEWGRLWLWLWRNIR
jgi:hypothetical protein